MKTLKHEEVHRVEYRNIADARRGIGNFLERTYNRKRLHSALGYRPPAEFDKMACIEIAHRAKGSVVRDPLNEKIERIPA